MTTLDNIFFATVIIIIPCACTIHLAISEYREYREFKKKYKKSK